MKTKEEIEERLESAFSDKAAIDDWRKKAESGGEADAARASLANVRNEINLLKWVLSDNVSQQNSNTL